jgi:hypothetical protein
VFQSNVDRCAYRWLRETSFDDVAQREIGQFAQQLGMAGMLCQMLSKFAHGPRHRVALINLTQQFR